jgi:hypothetical protein
MAGSYYLYCKPATLADTHEDKVYTITIFICSFIVSHSKGGMFENRVLRRIY